MLDLNNLLIDENVNTLDEDVVFEQVLTEWNVDPKKKKKLVRDIINKLDSEINKNPDIKYAVRIFKDKKSLHSGNNQKTVFEKKNVEENKRTKFAIGIYDFRKIDKEKNAYKQLNEIINKINFNGVKIYLSMDYQTEWVGYTPMAAIIAVITNLIKAGVKKNKVGIISIKIDKKSISEATDFSDSVLKDLFG